MRSPLLVSLMRAVSVSIRGRLRADLDPGFDASQFELYIQSADISRGQNNIGGHEFLKTAVRTATRYVPSRSCGTVYTPASLDFAFVAVVGSILVAVISAPGTTRPLGSVTEPVMVAKSRFERGRPGLQRLRQKPHE